MEDKYKIDKYYIIYDWMTTKLKLKGAERDMFAIIYMYHGHNLFINLSYMSKLTGYSKNTLCTALKSLVEKKLITKDEEDYTFASNILVS